MPPSTPDRMSATTPLQTPQSAPPATTTAPPQQEYLPSAITLLTAAKLAIKKDKPIMLDYFTESITGKAWIGEDTQNNKRVLMKSSVEFTSQVDKVYKTGPAGAEEFIVETENSIYIASSKVQRKRIQPNSLQYDDA